MSLIPGLGRYPGEGNGNPLQYLAWRIPWTEEARKLHTPWSCKELDMTEHTHTHFLHISEQDRLR